MVIKDGKCPKCGAALDYGAIGLQDHDFYWEVECPECGFAGKEWHTLTFDGFTDEAGEGINGEPLPSFWLSTSTRVTWILPPLPRKNWTPSLKVTKTDVLAKLYVVE
jgi:DNA-directed RNA polymerase subunit RPC12/RpoP